ncbi:hypothetical protein ACWATR_34405 [Nostoc sp. UIC 10890]
MSQAHQVQVQGEIIPSFLDNSKFLSLAVTGALVFAITLVFILAKSGAESIATVNFVSFQPPYH